MSNAASIPKVTRHSFHSSVLNAPVPVVVAFYSLGAKERKVLAPALRSLAMEFAHAAKFVRVDVEAEPRIAFCHGITITPALAVFRHGRMAGAFYGVFSPTDLKQWVEKTILLSEALDA